MAKGHMVFTKDYIDNITDVERDLVRRYIKLGKRLDVRFKEELGWQWWDYFLDHPHFGSDLPEDTQYGLVIKHDYRGKSCLPYIYSLNRLKDGKTFQLHKAFAGYYSHREDSERGI